MSGAGADDARARLKDALVRVAAGDRSALRVVYDATSAKLFGVVLRILGDRGEAEDVLQDVYLTVWRKADAFDPGRGLSPVTWLVALARNRAIDRLRARKDDRRRPLEDAGDLADPAPLASELAERTGEARRLHACLGELDDDHAEHVRRAFFGGLTYAELAGQAGVPLGTMKSWIRRALMQLRTCLQT